MFGKVEPLLKFKLRDILTMSEVYTIGMLILYSVFSIILYTQLSNALELILLNSLIIFGIIAVSTVVTQTNAGRLFVLIRRLYIIPIIFVIYSQVQNYIRVINPGLFDDLLIQWDFALFGVNPTEWLFQFSTPVLTEYLQLCYMLYFFMPVLHGIEIHFKREDKTFDDFTARIMFTFFISYLLYLVLPAVGPRFTIHEYLSLNTELPGIFLTDTFRFLIDKGGTFIPADILSAANVNRDCMPSGHTMITLVNMIMAFRYNSRLKWLFLVFGCGLIFSTVYLRYHYVVDVLAGIVLAVMIIFLEPQFRKLFRKLSFVKS